MSDSGRERRPTREEAVRTLAWWNDRVEKLSRVYAESQSVAARLADIAASDYRELEKAKLARQGAEDIVTEIDRRRGGYTT